MSFHFIKLSDFHGFIDKMADDIPVIAPQLVSVSPHQITTQEFFSFELLDCSDKLRLDYDVTILPPKKAFFPPEQVLLTFKNGQFQSALNPVKQVLLGVHPYDLIAIEQTDFVFTENHEDINYTAHREATTIIGSNIQKVAKQAFWSSMNTNYQPSKHDGFLTRINDGYVYEALTVKGEVLLPYGDFVEANHKQINLAKKENETIEEQCPQQLHFSSDEIVKALKNSFGNTALWDELAKDCYACGSCNTTCPTCYCFNIEDKWNVDQVSGARTRYWDSCMTEDFAKVSLGGGKSENFRETTGSRMRHRMMRKMVYLNDKLGTNACVGCGRCAIACTADIADPVRIINRVMEAYN